MIFLKFDSDIKEALAIFRAAPLEKEIYVAIE